MYRRFITMAPVPHNLNKCFKLQQQTIKNWKCFIRKHQQTVAVKCFYFDEQQALVLVFFCSFLFLMYQEVHVII